MGFNAEFVILGQTGRAYVAPPSRKKSSLWGFKAFNVIKGYWLLKVISAYLVPVQWHYISLDTLIVIFIITIITLYRW